jgi:hypothetical protein
MTRKVGRPRTYSKEQIEEIKEKLSNYIDNSSVPIIAEFAYQNDIPRQTFYDYEEFSTLIKKLLDKKEAQLERGALSSILNSTMAVFSLKQLGWRDKQEIQVGGGVNIVYADKDDKEL